MLDRTLGANSPGARVLGELFEADQTVLVAG